MDNDGSGMLDGAKCAAKACDETAKLDERDRKSTRLNSSHGYISYAVFCLKKKSSLPLSIRFVRSMLVLTVPFTVLFFRTLSRPSISLLPMLSLTPPYDTCKLLSTTPPLTV